MSSKNWSRDNVALSIIRVFRPELKLIVTERIQQKPLPGFKKFILTLQIVAPACNKRNFMKAAFSTNCWWLSQLQVAIRLLIRDDSLRCLDQKLHSLQFVRTVRISLDKWKMGYYRKSSLWYTSISIEFSCIQINSNSKSLCPVHIWVRCILGKTFQLAFLLF